MLRAILKPVHTHFMISPFAYPIKRKNYLVDLNQSEENHCILLLSTICDTIKMIIVLSSRLSNTLVLTYGTLQ